MIKDLYFIKNKPFKDKRGVINEVFRLRDLKDGWIRIIQATHTFSKYRVLRGLHVASCNRIIYPVTGKIFAAFVDTRPQSPSFKKVVTRILSGGEAVFIPRGVANSFCVIDKKGSHYLYFVSKYYKDQRLKGIAWNDPDLKIKWPIKYPVLSKKDKNNPLLKDFQNDN